MTGANIPVTQTDDRMSLASVDYSAMQSHIPVDTAAGGPTIVAWIRKVARLARSRIASISAVLARGVRARETASRVGGRWIHLHFKRAPRGGVALVMLTAVSAGTALLSAPTVTTLLPPSHASRDAMADRLARAEDSSDRQQAEIAGLAARLGRLTDQQAATAILAKQAADAAAQLETLHRDLGITAERLRQDISSLQESLARLDAQHSSDEAQLTATLSRITSLADSLTAALANAPAGSPQNPQPLRPAGKPTPPR